VLLDNLIDMVWLYRSPLSQWVGGGYFTSLIDLYLQSWEPEAFTVHLMVMGPSCFFDKEIKMSYEAEVSYFAISFGCSP
jgi:hypothetical protein